MLALPTESKVTTITAETDNKINRNHNSKNNNNKGNSRPPSPQCQHHVGLRLERAGGVNLLFVGGVSAGVAPPSSFPFPVTPPFTR